MFERYNEKARRAIFFARYEASQFGCASIEADFLLLGIAREDPSLCVQWLGANYLELRESIARVYSRGKHIPTHVDLPLSNQCKRVLAYAAEEAERLARRDIGTEDLLLALLREPDCEAAKMFKARDGDLGTVRAAIAANPEPSASSSIASSASVQVRLVDESGSELGVILWRGRVPDIGEAVSLPDPEDMVITYRVVDVNWQAKTVAGSGLQMHEVLLKVRNQKL